MPPSAYSQEETQAIKRLWVEGKSATEICVILADTFGTKRSRNAVIGKVHREGLSRKTTGVKINHAPRPPKPKRETSTRREVFTAKAFDAFKQIDQAQTIPANDKPIGGVTIIELRHNHCRWPISGRGEHMLSCGATKRDGSPYCAEHAKTAKGTAKVYRGQYTGATEKERWARKVMVGE